MSELLVKALATRAAIGRLLAKSVSAEDPGTPKEEPCQCEDTGRFAVYLRLDDNGPLRPATWCTRCHKLKAPEALEKAVNLWGEEEPEPAPMQDGPGLFGDDEDSPAAPQESGLKLFDFGDEPGTPSSPPSEPPKVHEQKTKAPGRTTKAPKLGYGEKSPTGERWITVHPNGKDEDGYPVKIKENPDGTATVIGGAGGALNGLRLTGVKSVEEYRKIAKQRAEERKAAKVANANAEDAKKRMALMQEAKQQGMGEAEAAKYAEEQITAQNTELAEAKARQVKEVQAQADAARKEVLQDLVQRMGWDPSAVELSDEEIAKARAEALEIAMQKQKDKLLEKDGKTLDEVTPKRQEKIVAAANAEADRRVAQVRREHEQKVVSQIMALADSARERVLAATDEIANGELADVPISDLVRETMGDTGKGYAASLTERARERGLSTEEQHEEKQDMMDRAAVERGSDPEKVKEYVTRLQAGASRARAEKKKLAEAVDVAGKVSSLDTDASDLEVGDAISIIQAAKRLKEARKTADRVTKDIQEADEIDKLPTSAVVKVKPISEEEALAQVAKDLAEEGRQRAMRGLVGLVHDMESDAPLREHRLTGHNAFFNEVSAITLGGAGIDPLVADVLGESATAHVMATALRQQLPPEQYEAVSRALRGHHIDTHARAAEQAVEEAKGLIAAAEDMDLPVPEDMDALLAGRSAEHRRIELIRKARQVAGSALGRIEAAAALNEALMGPKDRITISLGDIPSKEAVIRARAIGLDTPSVMEPEYGVRDGADGMEVDVQIVGHNEAVTGDYILHSDGKNRFIEITEKGLAKLAARLIPPQEDAALRRDVLAIQQGKADDPTWMPDGISRRPRTSFDWDPERPQPVEQRVQVDAGDGQREFEEKIKEVVARRIEAGHHPLTILSDMRSADYRASLGLGEAQHDHWTAALEATMPTYQRKRVEGESKQQMAQRFREHQAAVIKQMLGYHDAWLDSEVQSGRMAADDVSVHRQVLPVSEASKDLAYQIVTRDPRLQYAFSDVGSLGRKGRQAVRDYAYREMFGLDPREASEPLTPLTESQRIAWQKWRELDDANPPSPGGKVSGAYRHIQAEWAKEAQSGGGMFGEATAHDFATVDLDDDQAVIEAARKHAGELGYQALDRIDPTQWGKVTKEYPDLEPSDERPANIIAREARQKIKAVLRDRFFGSLSQAGDLVGSGFNPENVHTAGDRWTEYVQDIGGEQRAYATVLEKMRGDAAGMFAAAFERRTGQKLKTTAVPLTYGEAHAKAVLPPEQRQSLERQKASEMAEVRARNQGKFAPGRVAELLEAKQQAEAEQQGVLFGGESGKKEDVILDTHRTSIGASAERTLAELIPRLDLDRPMPAADADFGSEQGVKRQRFIRQFERAKRIGNSQGVGSGKSLMSLAGYTHLAAQGKVKRAIFAVPSAVQQQFGGEAYRFLDPEAGHTWSADPGLSTAERRAAYANQNIGMVVVTHQALRDDLIWAVAQHRFGGDEAKAASYMATAPRADREAAMKEATGALGWNFDMSVVDEGHNLLNRRGKAPSAMANAIDALTAHTEYHMSMSADPIKNDPSEAFDFLAKIRPDKYNDTNRDEFLRKYATGNPATQRALALEMAPYHYAERVDPGVGRFNHQHVVSLTTEQQTAHNDVIRAYMQARRARQRGEVDVESVRTLSPEGFEGLSDEEAYARAERLSRSLGILRDNALDRVVNLHENGAKQQKVREILGSPEETRRKPAIIFSRRLGAVEALKADLERHGYRVGTFTGAHSSKEKGRIREQFSPTGGVGEPAFDVLIASDAGAVGVNLQRGKKVIHYDTPYTAMNYEQRVGRAHRVGQTEDVEVHDLMTDTEYEHGRRKILERKAALRNMLTTPSELLDDTGLAHRIAQEEEAALQAHIRKAA